ncbi:MAG: sugar phosphate isomerase/epimerase [Clostridia bacterium]|nr:sugar phosphate isomerase/epimerase [Clostridia bacterium]
MKTAFTTLACPELSLSELLALAKRCDMDAVEVRLDKENRLCGLAFDEMPRARQLFDESGIALSDLACGISVKTYDESVLAQMEHCAKMAQALGVRGLRVFLGTGVKYFTDPIERDLDGVAKILRMGADLVAKYGAELWLETHSDYSTGAVIADVLARVNDPRVRVIWDAIHSIEWGESPMETVRLLGDAIVHVHLKDGTRPRDPNRTAYDLCALGAGDVDFDEVRKALDTIGYDGYLSLEWEQMWHPELAACYPSTDALLNAYQNLLQKHFL